MPIFQTAPGALRYQAFKTTFTACDESHLSHSVHLNLNRLRNNIENNPAEFVEEEDHLQSRHKESEGDGKTGETILLDDDATARQAILQHPINKSISITISSKKDKIGSLTISPTPSLSEADHLESST